MFTTILVQPLLNILMTIYAIVPGHDFGIAVIILTLLVRAVLWPLVSKQLHSQKLMQQLQPQVAKIREQAKGDKQKETQLLMELYKEKGTSPFAPLLPLLLQLPIFFALYAVLRAAVKPDQIAHLAYSGIAKLGPVANIIHHHAAFSPTLLHLIDLTKPSWILALAAGLAQYFQAKQLQPQTKAAMGDQASMMSSMTFIFPVVTFVIGLRLPGALALYWTVTSAAAIFQQYWVLQRDAQEMEAKEDVIEGEVVAARTKAAQPAQISSGKRSKKNRQAKGGAK